MAASSVQNPVAPVESKSGKKKKGKAAGRTESPAPAAASEKTVSVAPNDANGDDAGEPVYLRELSKNIRNLNKKLVSCPVSGRALSRPRISANTLADRTRPTHPKPTDSSLSTGTRPSTSW